MIRTASALPLLVVLLAARAQAAPETPARASLVGAPHEEAAPRDRALPEDGQAAASTSQLLRGIELLSHPGADAKATHSSQLPIGPSGSKISVQSVVVRTGRVEALLGAKSKERGVMLLGPEDVAALATGGRLTMSVSEDTIAIVAADHDGLVGIKGRFRPLPAGVVRNIDRKTARFEDTPVLPAPELTIKSRLHVALDGPLAVPLHVAEVAGATSYRVLLTRSDGSPVAQPRVFANPARAELEIVEPGNYLARVLAVDALGFEGAASAAVALHVLGLLPGQNLALNGTIVLEPGQRAQLAGTEGLLMRYGNSPQYVSAASSVGLSTPRPTTIEYRDPTDATAFALLTLVPRVLQSQVQMGPKTVQWPEQPVQIAVRLWDGQGAPVDEMSNYTPTVTVNGLPVPLEWSQGRGSLHTSLEPQPGPGPWVVRVSVKNARGIEVARDFLEVIERKKLVRPRNATETAAR